VSAGVTTVPSTLAIPGLSETGRRSTGGGERRRRPPHRAVAATPERYDAAVASRQIESRPERTPVLRKAAAGLVLLAVAALVIHVAVHLIFAVFWVLVGLVAVVAVLWALNTIL